MPELGKLYNLLYLKLQNAYTGQEMVIPRKMFLNLEVLCLEEMWHLRNIQVENFTLGLVKLEINNCPYMEIFFENFTTYKMKELNMTTTIDDQQVGIYLRNTACGYPAINGGGEIRTHDLSVKEIGQYNLPAR